jgi:NAD(P)-dependent dehydrogenase (short-subunit alcohol dehydrogenase family)
MRLLSERVAVITGSTKGNGRAMANLFSEHGGNVIVTGRDKNETQSVADGSSTYGALTSLFEDSFVLGFR